MLHFIVYAPDYVLQVNSSLVVTGWEGEVLTGVVTGIGMHGVAMDVAKGTRELGSQEKHEGETYCRAGVHKGLVLSTITETKLTKNSHNCRSDG